MITDVIDDSEVRNGIREDGTIYAVYSFARKLGQAFSSGLTGGLLTMIGYSAATAFDPEVTMGIFNISCIAPRHRLRGRGPEPVLHLPPDQTEGGGERGRTGTAP